jgi:hypothetical protein
MLLYNIKFGTIVHFTMGRIRRLILNGLLGTLLVLGQVSLLAHEALHEINSVSETICTVCLNSPHFVGANPPTALPVKLKIISGTIKYPDDFLVTPDYISGSLQPRAPPRSA